MQASRLLKTLWKVGQAQGYTEFATVRDSESLGVDGIDNPCRTSRTVVGIEVVLRIGSVGGTHEARIGIGAVTPRLV